jgi:hypothetical protein
MGFLKSVTKAEQAQFLKEIGFGHGKQDLSFCYALDGKWCTLPLCMRNTIPARWEQSKPDPTPEPKIEPVRPSAETFGPSTWNLADIWVGDLVDNPPIPKPPVMAYQPTPDREIRMTICWKKFWLGDDE